MQDRKRVNAARIAEDDAKYPDKNSAAFINLIVEIIVESTLDEFHRQQKNDVAPSGPIEVSGKSRLTAR